MAKNFLLSLCILMSCSTLWLLLSCLTAQPNYSTSRRFLIGASDGVLSVSGSVHIHESEIHCESSNSVHEKFEKHYHSYIALGRWKISHFQYLLFRLSFSRKENRNWMRINIQDLTSITEYCIFIAAEFRRIDLLDAGICHLTYTIKKKLRCFREQQRLVQVRIRNIRTEKWY